MQKLQNSKIAVIGLGYVGLPLAIEFAKKYPVTGFDINKERIKQLQNGVDTTLETSPAEIKAVLSHQKNKTGLSFSSNVHAIKNSNVFIVTVPTPLNRFNAPDLSLLLTASKMVGECLKKEDVVIYESTVYPGCTEEDCVPILEKYSNLKFNKDFFCGYSPERINPGDKVNTLTKIKKVTSGSTFQTAAFVDALYASIITAGTHKAPTIKVAEASKAIENAQRDVNISFMNELALMFDKMEIDIYDVLDAAKTKWNFLNFKPGLVGGHCISVDPYYLAHKAQSLGYHPQVILSGRRVNDYMPEFIAGKVVKLMIQKGNKIAGSKVLILGITFKENCPDIRNTKVVDIYKELVQFGINVDIYDPYANKEEVLKEFGIGLTAKVSWKYNAIILAVPHDEFLKLDFVKFVNRKDKVFLDVKGILRK